MIAQSPLEWSYCWTGKTSGVAGESAGLAAQFQVSRQMQFLAFIK